MRRSGDDGAGSEERGWVRGIWSSITVGIYGHFFGAMALEVLYRFYFNTYNASLYEVR